MKNFLMLFVTIATLGFAACSDDTTEPNDKPTPTPPADEVITLSEQAINNTYRQGYEGLGVDRYYFGLCDTYIDEFEGTYLPDNIDGTLFWCALYGAPAIDPENPTLPAGTYTLGSDEKVEGNLDSFYTYIIRRKMDSTPEMVAITAGTVTIEGGAGDYTIDFNYTLVTGETIMAHYEGDIKLNVGAPLVAPTPLMEEDYSTEFIGIHANIVESMVISPDSNIIGVQLYDEPISDEGVQSGGIVVRLELMAPKLEGPDPMIPDGTYNVSLNSTLYTTPVGDVLNLGSGVGITMLGTTARLMTEDGEMLYGAVASGSVTVLTTGAEQQITVDLTTGNGVNITGTYKGSVTISGYDYTPPTSTDPFSTLTEDKTLVADDNWSFTADYYTSHYHNRNDISFIRLRGYSIANPNDILGIPMEGFEGFRFDLIVENDGNITLPSGTYRPDSDGSHQPMRFELGSRQNGDGGTYYNGSYGYMGYDFIGFIDPTRMAPLLDGSLVITNYGDDTFGIQYNVIDDKGNKITFSHRSKVKIVAAQ